MLPVLHSGNRVGTSWCLCTDPNNSWWSPWHKIICKYFQTGLFYSNDNMSYDNTKKPILCLRGFSASTNQIISFCSRCFVPFFPETHPMHKTPNHLSSSTLFTITGKDLNPDQRLNFWNSTAESTSSKLNFPPISLVLLRTFFFLLYYPCLC